MKTTNKKEKTFDTVKVFREIKEKIAKETEKMTFAEFKEYLKKNSAKLHSEQFGIVETQISKNQHLNFYSGLTKL